MLIGSLATATSVATRTLRFWEARRQLHERVRTSGAYRAYPDQVAFLRRVRDAGLRLRQIGEVFAIHDHGHAPYRHAAALVDEWLADVTRRLTDLDVTHPALRRLHLGFAALDPAHRDAGGMCSAIAPPADLPTQRPPS